MSHYKSEVPGNLGIVSYKLLGWAISMAGFCGFIAFMYFTFEDDIDKTPGVFNDTEKFLLSLTIVGFFVSFFLARKAGIRFSNTVAARHVYSAEFVIGLLATIIVVWITLTLIGTENAAYALVLALVGYGFALVFIIAGR